MLLSQELPFVKRSLLGNCQIMFGFVLSTEVLQRSEKSQQHLSSIMLTLQEGREELSRGFTVLLQYFYPNVQLKPLKC